MRKLWCVLTKKKKYMFFLRLTVCSSIDRARKNYKITTLEEGRNQEKGKKIPPPTHRQRQHTTREKASTGPAAAKRDRPPLDQQRNTDEIAP